LVPIFQLAPDEPFQVYTVWATAEFAATSSPKTAVTKCRTIRVEDGVLLIADNPGEGEVRLTGADYRTYSVFITLCSEAAEYFP
jgi:hypothetical protein